MAGVKDSVLCSVVLAADWFTVGVVVDVEETFEQLPSCLVDSWSIVFLPLHRHNLYTSRFCYIYSTAPFCASTGKYVRTLYIQWVPLNIIPLNRISRLLSLKAHIQNHFLYFQYIKIRILSYFYYHIPHIIMKIHCFIPA